MGQFLIGGDSISIVNENIMDIDARLTAIEEKQKRILDLFVGQKTHLSSVMTLKESAQYTGYAVYHFRRLAAPYYRYMSSDSPDLAGEAQLAVYQVSSVLIDQNKDLSLASRYFRIVFRTRCIQLAAGVALANGPAANVAVKKNNLPTYINLLS